MTSSDSETDAQLLRESPQCLRQPQGRNLPFGGTAPAGGPQPQVPRHRQLHPVPLPARQGALCRRHQGHRRRRVHLRRAAHRLQDPSRVRRFQLLQLLQVATAARISESLKHRLHGQTSFHLAISCNLATKLLIRPVLVILHFILGAEYYLLILNRRAMKAPLPCPVCTKVMFCSYKCR